MVEAGLREMVKEGVGQFDFPGLWLRAKLALGLIMILAALLGLWYGARIFVLMLIAGAMLTGPAIGHLGLRRQRHGQTWQDN